MLSALSRRVALATIALSALAASLGCQALVSRPAPRLVGPQAPPSVGEAVPTEKDKSTLPNYTLEPPDILFIEAVRLVPKAPYHIQTTDSLTIDAQEGLEDRDRNAPFLVDSAGRVDLGPQIGKVKVSGLTEDEAAETIQKVLEKEVKAPKVSVTLLQSTGLQPVSGEHLISPDGRVNLGTYGTVYVAGMTLEEATAAIEAHLEPFLDHPQISISVFSYNSKTYYVITEGAGLGDQVARFPITGNETVLDAISQINGLQRVSSKKIWIARPSASGAGCDTVLPVNWQEITQGAVTATNYQILPGDRIFIAENKMIAFDAALNKMIAPFERIFGFTLLGTQGIQTINRFPLGLGIGSGF